jgi:hypothetical protein
MNEAYTAITPDKVSQYAVQRTANVRESPGK